MKFLVTFVTIIVCANAYRVRVIDSISSASSEELLITPGGQPQPIIPVPDSISSVSSSEEVILLPPGGPSPLPGVGVVSQSVLQAVKVKAPKYGNVWNTNRILAQVLGPQEATAQGARVYG
ncbi:uncharacterized protein LOC120777004 [Bactrocera tryoni]|uniref:uncharacterized protein LOC120777004 n=1 Tax=Bactrocera tryoni TaxID=59916 RepID=UPI001A99AE47|nr:uncharacterized protein LOC120777004 [Bactrocera tryoni]